MTTTYGARELGAASLRRTQPPETLGFGSTEEVQSLDGPVGQSRAAEALGGEQGYLRRESRMSTARRVRRWLWIPYSMTLVGPQKLPLPWNSRSAR